MNKNTEPQTLIEAIRYFSDPDVCLDFMARLRWPSGEAVCPTCGRTDVRFISTRRIWECKAQHPKRQFSIKVGTIFEDSPIGLDKWLAAIWMIANDKNGVSSYELHRALGVTQKTAWFMLHRIRLAMRSDGFGMISGPVEADETFIGGKSENMHKEKRERKIKSTGPGGKTVIFGLLERHGPDGYSLVRAKVVPNNRRRVLLPEIKRNVRAGARVFTDEHPSYRMVKYEYTHEVIDHAESYVRGQVHTNGLENFWSLLKRAIKGTYVNVEPFHLFRYLDEEVFRFNSRRGNDDERFRSVSRAVVGKRLTYGQLIGATTTQA
jgi:transposase-like protein